MALDSFTSDKKVEQYGELACKCGQMIDDAVIADSSKKIYAGKVRKLISEIEEEIPDPETVISTVSDRENSPSTKNVTIMAMKTYYKTQDRFDLAEKLGQLAEMEDFSPEGFSTEMEVEEWITEDEVLQIIEELCPKGSNESRIVNLGPNQFISNQEHKALVAALYYTGLRVSECLMIEVEHIDFEGGEMKVFRSKKGGNKLKQDTIRITDEFIEIIEDYMEAKDISEGELFRFSKGTVENRINEVEDAFNKMHLNGFENCDNLTPHKFRHGRVTEIANASSLEDAGEFVDHESIDTTMGYKHTTTDNQEGILPEDQRSDDEEGSEIDELLEEADVDSVDELKDLIGQSQG